MWSRRRPLAVVGAVLSLLSGPTGCDPAFLCGLDLVSFASEVSCSSVLPVVYRIWASARMGLLEGWFQSWVPDSVFSAGGGRSSVEAWYTTALDIEEVLSSVVDSDIHLFCS